MKVIVTVIFALGSVAAFKSGPYLPSGWRPQGPAFYLPTENKANPASSPEQEVLFPENEASGSDTLKEYGPPKLQDVSINFSNQGLPDIITEQVFQINEIKSNPEVRIEQPVVSDVNSQEELVAAEIITTTNSDIVQEANVVSQSKNAEIVSISEKSVEQEGNIGTQLKESEGVLVPEITVNDGIPIIRTIVTDEIVSTQLRTIEEPISTQTTVVDEITKLVIPVPESQGRSLDVDDETKVEEITQISVTSEEMYQIAQEGKGSTGNTQEVGSEEIFTSTEINTEVEQTTLINVIENNAEEVLKNKVNEDKVIIDDSVSFNNAEEKLGAVQSELVKEVQDVTVKGVNNIAEALDKLESEIKIEEVKTEVKETQQNAGTLEQGPEGFLEYGPPGFREYGPPKGNDLLRVIDQDINEAKIAVTNELRKRRFSPKLRSQKKTH